MKDGSVWHEVAEEPIFKPCDEFNSIEIIYTDKKGTHGFCASKSVWEHNVKEGRIEKWAYVSDLLKL